MVIAAALVAAGGWGVVRVARWRHQREKIRRVEVFRQLIWTHAQAAALPTELVAAVILHESGGDPTAVSAKGARGLMQISPITEREVIARTEIAKGDLFDPDYNIRIGTAYLRMLADRFDGDDYLTVGAYHLGPTRLAKLRQAHPAMPVAEMIRKHAPPSTVAYCRKVLARQ